MHDPVGKYTTGRTHDGSIHVWVHPSVVGNSFGGKLFIDGSLMCKYGAQGGQTGWAVVQIRETTHELVCSADGAMPISLPVQGRILRAELWALWQAIAVSEPGATFVSVGHPATALGEHTRPQTGSFVSLANRVLGIRELQTHTTHTPHSSSLACWSHACPCAMTGARAG